MKHIPVICLSVVFLLMAGLPACSDSKEITDKAAKEAVRQIRTPIEKAKAVKDAEERRTEEMDETASQQ